MLSVPINRFHSSMWYTYTYTSTLLLISQCISNFPCCLHHKCIFRSTAKKKHTNNQTHACTSSILLSVAHPLTRPCYWSRVKRLRNAVLHFPSPSSHTPLLLLYLSFFSYTSSFSHNPPPSSLPWQSVFAGDDDKMSTLSCCCRHGCPTLPVRAANTWPPESLPSACPPCVTELSALALSAVHSNLHTSNPIMCPGLSHTTVHTIAVCLLVHHCACVCRCVLCSCSCCLQWIWRSARLRVHCTQLSSRWKCVLQVYWCRWRRRWWWWMWFLYFTISWWYIVVYLTICQQISVYFNSFYILVDRMLWQRVCLYVCIFDYKVAKLTTRC